MSNQDDQYHLMRMNGMSPSGIPLPEKIIVHEDLEIGMTMGKTEVSQLPNGAWKASCPIDTIFGSDVEGEITATGKTKEEALAALTEERKKLNESLWY